MTKDYVWTSKLLDALDLRVVQAGQGSDYSDRIQNTRGKVGLAQALDLAVSEPAKSNQANQAHAPGRFETLVTSEKQKGRER